MGFVYFEYAIEFREANILQALVSHLIVIQINDIEEQMDLSERDEKIYIMRENGTTYRTLARTFNISSARVREIYLRIKDRKDNFDSWPPLKKLLSYRVQNALTNYFKNEDILKSPQKIVAVGRDDIRRIKNIGKKSIRELAVALYTLGFIKQDDKWFKP